MKRGNLGKGVKGGFGMQFGGLRATMSHVIANSFEWEFGVNQPLDARVTKSVRPSSMHFNPCFLKVEGYGCAHTAGSKGTLRGDNTKKEPSFGSFWAPVLEIFD